MKGSAAARAASAAAGETALEAPDDSAASAASEAEAELTPVVLCVGALMLLLAMLLNYQLKRKRVVVVTESGASMLLGLLTGWLAWLFLPVEPLLIVRAHGLHDLIYYAMLPPIIFVAGYTMRKQYFFKNFFTILLLAVPGTLVAALAFGAGLYRLVALRVLASPTVSGVDPLLTCLLFGALIASTDPVATLSILKEVRAPTVLANVIFGESALNDAVSIVIFNVFREAALQHADAPFDALSAQNACADFGRNVFGALLVGVAVGLGASATTKQLATQPPPPAARSGAPPAGGRAASSGSGALAAASEGDGGGGSEPHFALPETEVALHLVFATLSYVLGESLKLSGILSLFVAAIVMRHYSHHNLSETARTSADVTLKALAAVADTAICFTLGLAPFSFRLREHWDLGLVGASICGVFLSRALAVFPLLWLANTCFRSAKHRIPWRMQVVVWVGGLRGAISFALAITLDEARWTYAPTIVTSTLAVILFTNLVVGPLTKPMMVCLGLAAGQDSPEPLSAPLLDSLKPGASRSLSSRQLSALALRETELRLKPKSKFHQAWRIIDDHYVKPYVGGQLRSAQAAHSGGEGSCGGGD